MDFNHCGYRNVLRPALGLIIFLGLCLFALPAAAAVDTVKIKNVTVKNGNTAAAPGDLVEVTVEWTNTGNDVKAQVQCVRDESPALTRTIVLTKTGSGGTAVDVNFTIDWSVAPGDYAVTVDGAVYDSETNKFTVKHALKAEITSPTTDAPAIKSPGDTLTVGFNYKTNAQTAVFVRLAEDKTQDAGPVVDSKKTTLTPNATSGRADINIPTDAPFGPYTLTIVPVESNVDTEAPPQVGAVNLRPKASITSPTRTSPASVQPGASITVRYSYDMSDATRAEIHLLNGKGGRAISAPITLSKGKGSGSVTLTAPETLGRYGLEIRAGDNPLDTQREAVSVEHRVTADITAPRRSRSVTATAGEKVTVEFKYTASAKMNVEVRLQQDEEEPLVRSSVALEETSRAKPKSVELTIPKDAAPGRYDVVVAAPVSGKTLDSIRQAVRVETVVTAQITAPTKAEPETVQPGGRVSVSFDYTAAADASVEVKVTDADDKVLASRTAYLDETEGNKKREKTISVSIPSRAAAGKYDLAIYSKSGDDPLSRQEEAVRIKDAVDLTLQSPTAAKPAHLSMGEGCAVKFDYTAEKDSRVEFRLLKPDSRPLVSVTQTLPKTTRSVSKTVALNMAGAVLQTDYDLEIVNQTTGNTLAREAKAVRFTPHSADVQVRLVIGQSGRWVNGVYQPVDMAPRIIESRTLLPIRHVGEPLGWRFNWDNGTKEATVIRGEKQVRVRVGSGTAEVSNDNGLTWRTAPIDPQNPAVQPVLTSGRVLLPLRFVGETLDTRVDWNQETQTVTVTQGKTPPLTRETETQ